MEINADSITVEKVLAGDTEAYREIISRHGGRVYSLVVGIVRNGQDAEEVVADVFIKAFGQLRKFRGESKFSTWLYRIAYNSAISHVRRRGSRTEEIDERSVELPPDDAEDALLKEVRLERLERALELLPAQERALIGFFYMQDLSVEDISAITGDTPGNVKVKLYRSRKRLAALIGEMP